MYIFKNDDYRYDRLDKESGLIINVNNFYKVNDVCKWLFVSYYDLFIFYVYIN